jgi:hypothetical protein
MTQRKKLTYINERGDTLSFHTASQFHVNVDKDVSGLSSFDNDIFSINSMGQDGETHIGDRIEPRPIEIVGHIKERDADRAHRLRRRLNNILNPQFEGLLIYELGELRRVITPNINSLNFVKRPIFEQFVIDISCLNPFWREGTELRQDVATWNGGFEFPIDREDPPQGLEILLDTEDPTRPTWETGRREPSLIVNVFNGGDVRAGMRIDFRALGFLVNPTLLNVVTGEFIKINLEMRAGDVVTVNTAWGEKNVTLRSGGVESDAFRFLDPDSSYLQLAVGDNIFNYDADINMYNLDVTIHHNNLFLGV